MKSFIFFLGKKQKNKKNGIHDTPSFCYHCYCCKSLCFKFSRWNLGSHFFLLYSFPFLILDKKNSFTEGGTFKLKNEARKLQRESNQYNTVSTYSKYVKYQRKITEINDQISKLGKFQNHFSKLERTKQNSAPYFIKESEKGVLYTRGGHLFRVRFPCFHFSFPLKKLFFEIEPSSCSSHSLLQLSSGPPPLK